MSTSSRKQREVREREQKLLDAARQMLIEHGYAGLNMDRLAEATEYSKGTIYQHFSSKEDLVTALAVQSNERRACLVDRARRFAGHPREQMVAIGVADELFARLYPHYFRSESVIRMANLEERASDQRRDTLWQFDRQCLRCVREILQAAVDKGYLPLQEGRTVDQIVFAICSLAIGTHTAILNFGQMVKELQIGAPFSLLRENMDMLLDGFGCRPLRSEWDYGETYRRILQEVFARECQCVGLE